MCVCLGWGREGILEINPHSEPGGQKIHLSARITSEI